MSRQFTQNHDNYYMVMYDNDIRDAAQGTKRAALSSVTVSDNTKVLLLPMGYKGTSKDARINGQTVHPATPEQVKGLKEVAKKQDVYILTDSGLQLFKPGNISCAGLEESVDNYIKYGSYKYFSSVIKGFSFFIDLAVRNKTDRAMLKLAMTNEPQYEQIKVAYGPNFRKAQISELYHIVLNHAAEVMLIIDNFELNNSIIGVIRTALNNDVVVKLARCTAGNLTVVRTFVPVRKQYAEIANQCFFVDYKTAKVIVEARQTRQEHYGQLVAEQLMDLFQANRLYQAASPYEQECRDGYAEAVQQTMMFQNIDTKYQPRPMAKIDKNNKVANEKRAIAFKQLMNARIENAQNTIEAFLKDAKDQDEMLQLIRDYGKALGFNVSTVLEQLNDVSTFTIFQNKGKRIDTSYAGYYDYQIKVADYLKYTAKVNDNVLKNLPDIIRAAFEIDWFRSNNVEQFLEDDYRLCPVCGKPLSVNARTCKCGYEQADAVEIAEGNPEFISGTMQTVNPEESLTVTQLQMVAKAVELAGLPQDRRAVAATKKLMSKLATKNTNLDTAVSTLQHFYYGSSKAEEQAAATK